MDAKHELTKLLSGRRDGYWEFVATAVGDETSVNRTMAGISREALASNYDGPAVSPSIVDQRVQALIAYDEQKLVSLSRTWKAISEISLDVMDAEADFWTTAWISSLPVLKKHGEICEIPQGSIPRPLALEFAILFNEKASVVFASWDEAREQLTSEACNYNTIRELDAANVRFRTPIGQAELRELVDPTDCNERHLERLRFFFGRTHLINAEGRIFLETLLDENWVSVQNPDGSLTGSRSGIWILLEVVLQLSGRATPPDKIVGALLSRLKLAENPKELLPFVYRLVSPSWRHQQPTF
jgi:hypothetical protein